MGSSTITSYYGPSINPWRSVQADLTPGGSLRQPAAFCGLVGMKLTYGLCSRYGTVACASSLDHPSPVAPTMYDTALVLEHMAGHDPKDSTSLNVQIPHYTQNLTGAMKGLKIGIPQEYD